MFTSASDIDNPPAANIPAFIAPPTIVGREDLILNAKSIWERAVRDIIEVQITALWAMIDPIGNNKARVKLVVDETMARINSL